MITCVAKKFRRTMCEDVVDGVKSGQDMIKGGNLT